MSTIDNAAIEAALDHLRRLASENNNRFPTEIVRATAKRFDVTERTVWNWIEKGPPSARDSRELSKDALTEVAVANGNLKRAWETLVGKGVYDRSYRQFVRDYNRIDPILREGLTNGVPAAHAHGLYLKDISVGRLDRVIFDHTEADIRIQREFAGKLEMFRPWVSLLLDSHTRMILACVVTEGDGLKGDPGTESLVALMALAIRGRTATDGTFIGGVPRLVQFDNAKAHLAEAMLNGYLQLGIATHAIRPASPWEDGKVERLMRTFKDEFLYTLPGFVGVLKDRYARDNWKPEDCLSLAVFEERLAVWIDSYNFERHHTSLQATPFEVWRDDTTVIERVPDELIRHGFLSESNGRRVSKNGIRYRNVDYVHPKLAPLVGKKVNLRYLPNDRTFVDVFVDGAHVCTAVPHNHLTKDQRINVVKNRHQLIAQVESIRKQSRKRASERELTGNPLLQPERNPLASPQVIDETDDEFLSFVEAALQTGKEKADGNED